MEVGNKSKQRFEELHLASKHMAHWEMPIQQKFYWVEKINTQISTVIKL